MFLFGLVLCVVGLVLIILLKGFWKTPKTLKNDTILITGAAHGLGRMLALHLSEYCPNIIGLDKNILGLQETALLVYKKSRATMACYQCDLCISEEIRETAKQIREKHGRVTVLISNAGIVNGNYLLDSEPSRFENLLRVNLFASYYLLKEFLPGMLGSSYSDCIDRIPSALLNTPPINLNGKLVCAAPQGHIVFTSSIASRTCSPALGDYCASKAALSAIACTLRLELDVMKLSDKITVTDFRPFAIDTGMFQGFRAKLPFILPILKTEDVARRLTKAIRFDEGVVYFPWQIWFLPVLESICPRWILRIAYQISGVYVCMDEYEHARRKDV